MFWTVVKTTAIVVAVLLALPAAAYADIVYEEGATFDGGLCWEADGTEGFTTPDGQCVTPADYAEMFSYENLSQIPSLTNPELSIAEEAGITPDSLPADERLLGVGLVERPATFRQLVAWAHQPF